MLIPVARFASSRALRTAPDCSSCAMGHLCMPGGLPPDTLALLDSLIRTARIVKRGDAVFRAGDAFHNLYAVRSGSLKTVATRHDGREQVIGMHLAGEAVGLDGIADNTHTSTAIALEDSAVCVIPYRLLTALCAKANTVQLRMHKLMSEQLVRETVQAMLLGSLSVDERVAAFLLDTSSRYQKRGFSAAEFNLRMTREDIGSYLGMTLETVSRTLSKFRKRGLIDMRGRVVRIVDLDGLRRI